MNHRAMHQEPFLCSKYVIDHGSCCMVEIFQPSEFMLTPKGRLKIDGFSVFYKAISFHTRLLMNKNFCTESLAMISNKIVIIERLAPTGAMMYINLLYIISFLVIE